MENPVVVFFDSTSKHDTGYLTFPIGWTEDGRRLDGVEAINGNACSVILLDDNEKEIPATSHTNKDREKPLMLVLHKNSTLHKWPEVDEHLRQWGRCSVWGKFSHLANSDATFQEIVALLIDAGKARQFALKRHRDSYLALLDQLAAVCQICIITPDQDVSELRKLIMKKITDRAFKESFDLANDWQEKLAVVRAKADSLAT